jgi:hypothetical protein
MPIATVAQLASRLPDFDPDSETDVALVTDLLNQATALIEGETGESYAAASGSPASRSFYGDGTPYLAIDEHDGTIEAAGVTMPDGYTEPAFVDRGRYLVTTTSTGDLASSIAWPAGVPVAVSADWGRTAPGDLVSACLDIAAAWYVRSYASDAGAATGDLPPAAARTLARYRRGALLRRSGTALL